MATKKAPAMELATLNSMYCALQIERDQWRKLAEERGDALATAKLEISRKELVINQSLKQLQAARSKLAAAPVSDIRARMAAAKEEAMRTGTTVRV